MRWLIFTTNREGPFHNHVLPTHVFMRCANIVSFVVVVDSGICFNQLSCRFTLKFQIFVGSVVTVVSSDSLCEVIYDVDSDYYQSKH